MPASVYKLVFCDPDLKKLAPSRLEICTYTTDTVKLVGSLTFYLVHPDTKCLQEVTFYVASNNGSVLLSCATMLALGLIQPCTRLDCLPPRATLITSSADHQKKTKYQPAIHVYRSESTVCSGPSPVPKHITSKEQILQVYPEVFDGIGHIPGPLYHIQVHPSITPKQTPCQLVPVHHKEPFKQEIDKMLQAGILKPVHQATPWMNSFVLVEGKDKLGKLKLKICLDLTNLNKVIVHEPYHFKTPGDIALLLAEACVITVSDCRKGFWHQQLDQASSFLTTFNTELGRFCYTVLCQRTYYCSSILLVWYHYLGSLQDNTIFNSQLSSEGQIGLYLAWQFSDCTWPSMCNGMLEECKFIMFLGCNSHLIQAVTSWPWPSLYNPVANCKEV